MDRYGTTGMLDPVSLEKREDGRLILRSDYEKRMNLIRQAWKAMCEAVVNVDYQSWLLAKTRLEMILSEED